MGKLCLYLLVVGRWGRRSAGAQERRAAAR